MFFFAFRCRQCPLCPTFLGFILHRGLCLWKLLSFLRSHEGIRLIKNKKRKKENSPPTVGIRFNFSRWGRWEVEGGGRGGALQRRIPSRQKHPPHACPWHRAAIAAPLCPNLQRFPRLLPTPNQQLRHFGFCVGRGRMCVVCYV